MLCFGAVVPDLESQSRQRKGGEVPATAVELASQYCMRYIRSRCHEDLDKVRGMYSLKESIVEICIVSVSSSDIQYYITVIFYDLHAAASVFTVCIR